MPKKVRIPTPLRKLTNNEELIEVNAAIDDSSRHQISLAWLFADRPRRGMWTSGWLPVNDSPPVRWLGRNF